MKNKIEQLVPKQLNLKGRKHALVTMPPNNLQFNALESFVLDCRKKKSSLILETDRSYRYASLCFLKFYLLDTASTHWQTYRNHSLHIYIHTYTYIFKGHCAHMPHICIVPHKCLKGIIVLWPYPYRGSVMQK